MVHTEQIRNPDGVLLVKQEVWEQLCQVDSLIFDVDGVLLDVSRTFQVIICETVNFYAEKVLGWIVDAPLLLTEETELFKRAGGFNNDWDLTQAVVLFYLFKHLRHGVKQSRELRRLSPSLEEFTSEVARRGGGLQNAESYILPQCNIPMRRQLSRLWNRRLVVQIFQELYGGERWCAYLYGFKPQYVETEGMVEKETVLINPAKIPAQLKGLGILTGRTRREAELALMRTGLRDLIPQEHWVTDDEGLRKPDPRSLSLVLERIGATFAIYIGDALDDLRTVENYRESASPAAPRVLSCMTLTGLMGERNKQLFLEQGADIVASNVNVLLESLASFLAQRK